MLKLDCQFVPDEYSKSRKKEEEFTEQYILHFGFDAKGVQEGV